MIKPEDIRQKAERLYEVVLSSWTENNCIFPYNLAVNKQLDDNISLAVKEIELLKKNSKEMKGYGYTVQWQEKRSRKYGQNLFPDKVLFETREDYLKFIDKQTDFDAFTHTVLAIRSSFPQLESWIRSNLRSINQLASDIDKLIQVVGYFQLKPRPNCFAREIPLEIDTKFIERNKMYLRQWLDVLLPPHAIRSDEAHFERRFGLRYAQQHIIVRFLDSITQKLAGFPCDLLSLPPETIAQLHFEEVHVIIVENKINLLTLPSIPNAIALGALGKAVTVLRDIGFLSKAKITYWGDVDADGFEILSSLRQIYPQTQSILMDIQTLDDMNALIGEGNGKGSSIAPNLTSSEKAAYEKCLKENIRLEQERIPHKYVLNKL